LKSMTSSNRHAPLQTGQGGTLIKLTAAVPDLTRAGSAAIPFPQPPGACSR